MRDTSFEKSDIARKCKQHQDNIAKMQSFISSNGGILKNKSERSASKESYASVRKMRNAGSPLRSKSPNHSYERARSRSIGPVEPPPRKLQSNASLKSQIYR